MNNSIGSTEWKATLTTTKCQAVIFIIIAVFSLGAISCAKPPKGRIEQLFETYVDKNFANPSDLIEIASIELEDSIDFRQICELYLNQYCPDSVDSKIIDQIMLMPVLAKQAPTWFNRRNGEYDLRLISSEISDLRLAPGWEHLKREYEKVDTLNLIERFYTIKARVKQNEETIMKIFYAVDYMIVDSLAISDKEIPITDCPHDVLAFTEALDSYIKLVKIKLDYLNEITEFNNKQRKASL